MFLTLEELQQAQNKVVGTRQTTKALDSGSALVVFIAEDADEKITEPIVKSCSQKGIKLCHVDSMSQLGKACNIKVGAAVAAVVAK